MASNRTSTSDSEEIEDHDAEVFVYDENGWKPVDLEVNRKKNQVLKCQTTRYSIPFHKIIYNIFDNPLQELLFDPIIFSSEHKYKHTNDVYRHTLSYN